MTNNGTLIINNGTLVMNSGETSAQATCLANYGNLTITQQKEGTTVVSETGAEVRFQLYLVVQTALLFAIIIYYYAIEAQGDKMLSPAYEFVGACFMHFFSKPYNHYLVAV